MENIDEAEDMETLSLFEYSINTTAAAAESEWEDYSASIDIDHGEHNFEFCSEEWSTTTISNPPDNIIFCGKVIAYQEATYGNGNGNAQNPESKKGKGQKKSGLFQWKSKRKDCTNYKKEERKSLKVPESRKFSVHKISILASPGKFRWYLLFGVTRFPKEMALRDMKKRQSRIIPSSTFFRLEGGEKKKVKISSTHESKNKGKRLWKLLKASICMVTTMQTP